MCSPITTAGPRSSGSCPTGLTGYDTLQEGLAVLSEYLVGGLSRPRLRLLGGEGGGGAFAR